MIIVSILAAKHGPHGANGMVKKGKPIGENLYEYENKNPRDYFEYANPDTLSMSFEGNLFHVLNGYVSGWIKLEQQFAKLFEKHGITMILSM